MKMKLAAITAIALFISSLALHAADPLGRLKAGGITLTTNKSGVVTMTVPVPPKDKAPLDPTGTNTVPVILDMLSHTNLYVGAGVSYDLTESRVGGVIGLAYVLELPLVEDMLMPEVRGDYDGKSVWMLEGTLTIKPPRSIAGKWPVRPIGEVAVATSFTGDGADNGKVIPIVGAGIQANIAKGIGVIVGYEWWWYPERLHEKVIAAATYHF